MNRIEFYATLRMACLRKCKSLCLREPFSKMGSVFVALFPPFAIAQLIIYSVVTHYKVLASL